MTSVNSPACLLARNHFHRSFPSEAESCGSERVSPRHLQLSISMATPTGFPLDRSPSLSVDIVLTSPLSLHVFSSSKPSSPSDRGIK